MPVQAVYQNGKVVGYKYGETGKLYSVAEYGEDKAKFLAIQQALAIQHSQKASGKQPSEPVI